MQKSERGQFYKVTLYFKYFITVFGCTESE